jgi:glycosyltransferase involved in cell wall biosynthesis
VHIIFVIDTDGLEYDERVRKEAQTLIDIGHSVHIIALEGENKKKSGETNYGSSYSTISLLSRRCLPHKRFLIIKALEMHLRFLFLLMNRRWDVLWVHVHSSAGIVLYGWLCRLIHRRRRLVWDLHELGPQKLIQSNAYHWLVGRADGVINANADRSEYLDKWMRGTKHGPFYVLENWPLKKSVSCPNSMLPQDFAVWLRGQTYILYHGVVHRSRRILECIEVVMTSADVKLLVLGPCSDDIVAEIRKIWPHYEDRVFISGWVSPHLFPSYMDRAQASLVFYDSQPMNQWLCAPNRFYHALARGTPIICGPNPTMRKIVEDNGNGIVCNNNGTDPREIAKAVRRVVAEQEIYRRNSAKIRANYTWESQVGVFQDIFSGFQINHRTIKKKNGYN